MVVMRSGMKSGVADDEGDDEDISKTKGGRRFSMMLVDPDRHVTKVNKRERKKGVANLNVRILQESASLNGGESGENLTQLRVKKQQVVCIEYTYRVRHMFQCCKWKL